MNTNIERITIDPLICQGNPVITGMRWPVEVTLDMISSEMAIEEMMGDYPELEKEDIIACLNYARLSVSGQAKIAR